MENASSPKLSADWCGSFTLGEEKKNTNKILDLWLQRGILLGAIVHRSWKTYLKRIARRYRSLSTRKKWWLHAALSSRSQSSSLSSRGALAIALTLTAANLPSPFRVIGLWSSIWLLCCHSHTAKLRCDQMLTKCDAVKKATPELFWSECIDIFKPFISQSRWL